MQSPRILITDGGPHPADKWAAITAAQICDLIVIDTTSTSEAAAAARRAKPRLELDLVDLLVDYHAAVQAHERAQLEADGDSRLAKPPAPDDGIVDTPAELAVAVAEAAANTPFAAHFALPRVKAIVAGIVADHVTKVIDVERSWHADRNPGSQAAQTYARARIESGPRDAHARVAAAAGRGHKAKA